MGNLRKIGMFALLTFVFLLLTVQPTFAGTLDLIKKVEYSDDFNKWLELSEEEQQEVLMPRAYDIKNTNVSSKNPIHLTRIVKASVSSSFSLKNLIPENLEIKDQQQTSLCWAFASMSSLETNLALSNYRKGISTPLVYDYSERHMRYATIRSFADGGQNEMGYNSKPEDGGNFLTAQSYFTNGTGAIPEKEMPFENNEDLINISEIQNKTVSSQVYDTVAFQDYNEAEATERTEIMNQIKQHIQDYGSVYASLHGDYASIKDSKCYNMATAAKYCSDTETHPVNHAVAIIGWDDDYAIENFLEGARPTQKGAWIARNSWGGKTEIGTVEQIKQAIFATYENQGLPHDWNSPDDITNEEIMEHGFTIEGNTVYQGYGDNGLLYISYEDVNVSGEMYGIIKATDTTTYDYIYQYDELTGMTRFGLVSQNVMVGNVFNKKTSGTEYLTQVSIQAPQTYTCKVYVNPNGSDFSEGNMQLVQLEAGETETFNPGYHTIEFAEPVEITGNTFAVVVQIKTNEESTYVALESKMVGNSAYDFVSTEKDKCFITGGNDFNNSDWIDLGRLEEEQLQVEGIVNGDSTIKAFTVTELPDESLEGIKIITPPDKVDYIEGQDFDKTGMVVVAYYNSLTNPSVILDDSSYNITNGSDLELGQESITVEYQGKTATQPITVEENTITDITIKTPPDKTEYKEGEDFDDTGMEVEVTYKDGTTEIITDYTIEDGEDLEENQTEITIKYEDKTVTQPITVISGNELLSIEITKAPNKVSYIIGQDFDKTGMIVTGIYENGRFEITDYTIPDGEDLQLGQTYITVEYEGKTATQPITVTEKTIIGISIERLPDKLTYIQNKEELDLTGGLLKISYNDGSSETIDLNSEQINTMGFDNKELGKIKITVDYESKTTHFDVEIIEEKTDEPEEPEDEGPVNTDFTNAKVKLHKIRLYLYTDKDENQNLEYVLLDTEINTILRELEKNDGFEYYYYLSPNAHEENIQDWVEIPEEQDSALKLDFLVDTRKISNYDELIEGDNLYIYIREVAKKGGNQSVVVSPALEMKEDDDTIIEVYVDGDKLSDIDINDDNNDNDNDKGDSEDNTIADGPLPQTGIRNAIIVVSIVALSVVGAVCYIKYNKLRKLK